MVLDGGGGVAECLGDDGHGRQFGQLMEGAEPGRSCAEDTAKTIAKVAGVDVAAGGVPTEYPVAVGMRCGQVVARARS